MTQQNLWRSPRLREPVANRVLDAPPSARHLLAPELASEVYYSDPNSEPLSESPLHLRV